VSKLANKVAFITGAARGQGRSHALRLAEEGVDIIAVDIARQIATVPYPLATSEDLEETARQVRERGRRIVSVEADVRDPKALAEAVDRGVAELGRLDIILANAGIAAQSMHESDPVRVFDDVVDVNLKGVRHTVHAGVHHMIEQGEGGAIVLTSSTQGLTGRGGNGSGGQDGYAATKHGIVGLMRTYANWLARYNIRVNSVHPTGVNTPMVVNDAMQEFLTSDPHISNVMSNLMPVEMIEAVDVSNAVAWLVSDQARYVTGVPLPVDAGFTVR